MVRPVLSVNRTLQNRGATQVRHPSRLSRVYSPRGYLLGRTFNKSNFFFSVSITSNVILSFLLLSAILEYKGNSEGMEGEELEHEYSHNLAIFLKKTVIIRALELLAIILDILHFKKQNVFIRGYNYWFLLNKVIIYVCFFISLTFNWKHIYIGASIADFISYATFFYVFRKNFIRYRNSPCFLPMILWPFFNGSTQILVCFKVAELLKDWNYILIPCYILAGVAFILGIAFFALLKKFYYDKFGKEII